MIYLFMIFWILCSSWALYMWYRGFGGFNIPFGLEPSICFLALLGGPVCAIAWTICYLTLEKEERFK